MAYWRDIYRFRDSNEYEIKWAGNYGAKGEKRSRRTKATPEQVKKQNRINKTNYVRRKIKLNFEANDYWLTFTFQEKQERTSAEVKGYLSKMIGKLRKEYRRAGTELKWISRVEIGKYGGIHAHMIINRIRGETGTDLLIQNAWEHGRVFFSLLYEEGGFKKLAEYLVKPPLEEHQDDKGLRSYSCSRNLKKPEPERKYYRRWTVKKLLEEGPVAKPGYYIDKDSIVQGENRYTGYSYMKYTEVRLEPEGHRRI